MVRSMNRLLIVGGGGFIGAQLIAALRGEGETVTAPTRAELDIAEDTSKLAETLQDHDTLIILTQPDEQGISNIVSALALSAIQHVLYASTVLVYGSSKEPQSENGVISPASEYARAKYEEEEVLRKCGVPLTIARLGNVYGGPRNKGIVQKAIQALYRGQPLEIRGEDQVRDFVHVEDVVKSLVALSKLPSGNRIVNVMTGVGTSIRELFTTLERLSGKNFSREKGPESELVHSIGNVERLRELTGFVPEVSLEEGLKKTLYAYDQSIQK